MPEIRQNLATREWVIIATERAMRPEEFVKPSSPVVAPPFVAACPFCPGNEDKCPSETHRVGEGNTWRVRTFPNKFSALTSVGDVVRRHDGIRNSMSGVGLHEVIVESPLHNTSTALVSLEQLADVLTACQARYEAAHSDPRVQQIVIFKNHGATAGTSIEHPHWQMIALPLVPFQIRCRLEAALDYYDDHGECLYCRMILDEVAVGVRLVNETEHFVAFCPYAAASPFHLWILPKRHMASFDAATPGELYDLGRSLLDVLRRVHFGLGNPDFNLIVRSAPVGLSDSADFHWYVTIVPRVSKTAGFELGSGMFVNTAFPEESAKFLRGVKLPAAT